jgi:hypothetical protein
MSVTRSSKDYFGALRVRDLVEARDAYHVHLMNKSNVVATALGRYLIRDEDWYASHAPNVSPPAGYRRPTTERTLFNSRVRDWSWPCILVFVKQWLEEAAFASQPDNWIPRSLYLPDGRVVPTCVVRLVLAEERDDAVVRPTFPKDVIGGGHVIFSNSQGVERYGSVGCLVEDGGVVYALTNRHVAGEPGTPIYSRFDGRVARVGITSDRRLAARPFNDIYPEWPGNNTFANLDLGLIKVESIPRWATEVVGLGRLGAMVNLATSNVGLELIGQRVVGYGGMSGNMSGTVAGLFYRYDTVGGTDFICDLLLETGTRGGDGRTRPGDSGTLWCLEPGSKAEGELAQPLALEWGGHVAMEPTAGGLAIGKGFALGTFCSTACRVLGARMIRGWQSALPDYWGELGHYAVGLKATRLPSSSRLRALLGDRSHLIGFDDAILKVKSKYKIQQAHYYWVPLADVADNVWRDSRPEDSNSHFADMDRVAKKAPFKNKSLLDLCKADMANVDPEVWNRFYDTVGEKRKGALPFRIWQIYDAMVGYLRAADVVGYFAAAGVMAHYNGDACQPLHVSEFHHNTPGTKSSDWRYGVHSSYETMMLDDHRTDVVKGITARLDGVKVNAADLVVGGRGAARAVVALMMETIATIDPRTLCGAYNSESTEAERVARLWQDFGTATMDMMARGCIVLATLWESAWREGNGDAIDPVRFDEVTEEALSAYYRDDPDFVPSMGLEEMIDAGLLG